MAPPFPEAKITLDYPLYACDFDPQDSNRLIVGGGGGGGRTGVKNKISLLNTSLEEVKLAGEVTLREGEDNVTTLVAGQRKGKATLIYAGINSPREDLDKGKNEHFRVLGAEQSSKAKAVLGPRISELSRSQLFTTRSPDTYQRLLRLSQPFSGSPQLGAVATGMADDAQIALFDLSAGASVAPKLRGVLELSKEAADLDVIQTGDKSHQLIYCDAYDLYVMDTTKPGKGDSAGGAMEPRCVYTIPHDDNSGLRPALRCVRYLTPHFVLAVANLPKAGGIVLYGFRLPKAGGHEGGKARIAVSAKLPRSPSVKVLKATGLAVANLAPPAAPGARQGDTQFVVAVSSNDFSISLYALEHQAAGDVDMLANLLPLRALRQAHPGMITGLAFSRFAPPKSGTARLQVLKLASTSVYNIALVHAIPLKKRVDRSAPQPRGGPPRRPRYVVAAKPSAPSGFAHMAAAAIVLLVLAVFLQGYLEVKGLTPPVVGGHRFLPASWHAVPAAGPPRGTLAELLAARKLDESGTVVQLPGEEAAARPGSEGALRVETHDESTHGPASKWQDLSPAQRRLWRDRLKASGKWVEGMGEDVFKGLLFGELVGAVGAAVGG